MGTSAKGDNENDAAASDGADGGAGGGGGNNGRALLATWASPVDDITIEVAGPDRECSCATFMNASEAPKTTGKGGGGGGGAGGTTCNEPCCCSETEYVDDEACTEGDVIAKNCMGRDVINDRV